VNKKTIAAVFTTERRRTVVYDKKKVIAENGNHLNIFSLKRR